MTRFMPLHRHAMIKADFPLRVPTLDDPRGSALEFAQWLQNELSVGGVDCTPPEDVQYGHEIACTVDGRRLTIMLSVDNLMDGPTGFHLDLLLPGKTWWQRWRGSSEQPAWWEAAREWAARIDGCLAEDDRIRAVTWYPEGYADVPLPSYPTATSDQPINDPPLRWHHRLVLFHNRAFGWIKPIAVFIVAGALGSVIHPRLVILAYLGFAIGMLWFCLMMTGFGACIAATGVASWNTHMPQGRRSLVASIWSVVLIAAGFLVGAYFLVLPVLIVRSILNK